MSVVAIFLWMMLSALMAIFLCRYEFRLTIQFSRYQTDDSKEFDEE